VLTGSAALGTAGDIRCRLLPAEHAAGTASLMAALSIQRSCESTRPAPPRRTRISSSPAQMPGFYFQREAQAMERSMSDNLELATFLAVLIAFVVCGCLVTRAPTKTTSTGSVKD
jgi:hypothetical protein